MEKPKSIFRTVDGSVFEDYDKAFYQSIFYAADNLRSAMCSRQCQFVDVGLVLNENEVTIRGAMKELESAFNGEHVTQYNKVRTLTSQKK